MVSVFTMYTNETVLLLLKCMFIFFLSKLTQCDQTLNYTHRHVDTQFKQRLTSFFGGVDFLS